MHCGCARHIPDQKWSKMFPRLLRCIYPEKKAASQQHIYICVANENFPTTHSQSFPVQVFRWTRLDDLYATGTLAMALSGKETEKKRKSVFFPTKTPPNLFLQKKNFEQIFETLLSRDFVPDKARKLVVMTIQQQPKTMEELLSLTTRIIIRKKA